MTRPAIHPGKILAEELEETAVTLTELARRLRVPANRITQIVQGKRSITGDTALRLGHWFGTSAQFWLNLQNAYDIRVAGKAAGAEIAKLPRRQAAPNTGRAGHDEWQIAGIKRAIASLDRGEGVPHEQVKKWVRSWGSRNERPMPRRSKS